MPAVWLMLFVASVSAGAVTVVQYRVQDGLVSLDVRVNGSRPLTFVLDSGAPRSIVQIKADD